ncbi:MAG: hypothetical protein E7150_14225 [Bacillus sp. (in: Bacteria)]|nr:hypothetical protein [Bacillus sp. (in: firmicutes)]
MFKKSIRNEARPFILQTILIIAAIVIFFAHGPNTGLWVGIILYLIIDIGFLIAIFLGIKTRKKSIVIFSIISNGIFFILLFLFIFILAFANGILVPK